MTNEEIHAIVSSLEFKRFHNGLRCLRQMGLMDLVGVTDMGHAARASFERSPFSGFIMASDEAAAQIWQIIEARQPEELR